MNISNKFVRKGRYISMISKCDKDSKKISLLIDRIIELEDSLNELQQNYFELLTRSRLCALPPF